MSLHEVSHPPTLTGEALMARIDKLPRVRLAHLPTPLDFCPRLTEALGGPQIYIKRDDLTGLAFGGNKTRLLEFLFAEIVANGADTVVAGAYTQSNWCRQITAAACKLGLETALVLVAGVKGPARQGNLLLDLTMGADVTVVDGHDMQNLAPDLWAKAARLEAAGRKPYVIAPFDTATQAIAGVGYVAAMVELDRQLADAEIAADYIYLSAANTTPAGLTVGARALGRAIEVVGITPIHWDEDRPTDIARIAEAIAARLDLDCRFTAADIVNDDGYVGERYGIVTPAGLAALKLVARTEGIILDPIYTAKAMAGLIDHIRQGRIGRGESVVFVHTGGTPALFAYADDLELG